jgi:hypothetical protein
MTVDQPEPQTTPPGTRRAQAFAERWQARYPAAVRLWQARWTDIAALWNFPPRFGGSSTPPTRSLSQALPLVFSMSVMGFSVL